MNFAALDADKTLIVTASRRQARFIREQYALFQIEQGNEVWHSLKVMPWSAFINYCWEMALDSSTPLPIRLGQFQSKYLWQEMVQQSEVTQSLLNTKQTQKLSLDAWRVCQQWQILKIDYLPGDQDQMAFEGWYKKFQQLLEEKGWVDLNQQPNVLLSFVSSFVEELPQTIITYGFQQPTPQQEQFFANLAQHKNLQSWKLKSAESIQNLLLYSLPSPELELLAAVRWAREKLMDDSEQTIAIVVPELDKWRGYLERIIQRELYAEDLLYGKESLEPLHDFSIDEPLLRQPIVALLMDWLTLTVNRLTKQQLQHLLLSPYLYEEQEQHWQATELELIVRQSTKAYYSLSDIVKLCRRFNLKFAWVDLAVSQQELEHTQQELTQHISALLALLSDLHWDGYCSLSSREFQVQQTLIESIKSAQSLQKVLPATISYSRAINVLKQYLEQQTFHQQKPKSPLQVIGLLESIGLTFNAVWVVGATDQTLPQKANPNPFLSKALHIKHQLPGASHHRELEYAQSLLESLFSNGNVIMSYAEFDGEQEQMISPLLLDVSKQNPVIKLEMDTKLPIMLEAWNNDSSLEYFDDEEGLPIINEHDVKGGTGLLRMQAASPFDAYLRYRLQLQPFDIDGLGLSFMDRGNLFHKIMQIIWQRLKDQKTLLGLELEEQKTIVNRTIDFVLGEAKREVYLLGQKAFYDIEKKRLYKLVDESLALDKKREPFSVVGTEVPRVLELAGLKFSMVIDRIDRLEDGQLLIIDYKTGQPSLVSLFRDPIAEPQLLMYAISEQSKEEPIAGVVFMQAHLKACKYIGVTGESETLEGVKALKDIKYNPYSNDLNQAIKEWQFILEQLAQDFKDGKANLTEYSGNFSDYVSVSRWAQRDENFKEKVEGNIA